MCVVRRSVGKSKNQSIRIKDDILWNLKQNTELSKIDSLRFMHNVFSSISAIKGCFC